MEAKLQKWGNSYGIRIPSVILKSLNLKINDKLNLIEENNKIVITKSNNNKISLKKRFEEYKGDNMTREFIWDKAVGDELW